MPCVSPAGVFWVGLCCCVFQVLTYQIMLRWNICKSTVKYASKYPYAILDLVFFRPFITIMFSRNVGSFQPHATISVLDKILEILSNFPLKVTLV